MQEVAPTTPAPRPRLSLLDSTSIIVGIIIGAGIYESSDEIARFAGGPWAMLAAWLLGGVMSLAGAACYAELITMLPHEGGDYVFVTRAYGRRMGFLLAWAWFWIVRPGSIGAMAFIFARYAQELLPLGSEGSGLLLYAIGSVIALTALNLVGLRGGTWTQNALTVVKVLGLLAVFAVGIFTPTQPVPVTPNPIQLTTNFPLAMVFVLFTYGGWNDISYVAAEVKDPNRNILRSLMLGTGAVTLIYLLVNLAFLNALGFAGVAASEALGADALRPRLGEWGARVISSLVCVSSLGAINGMVLTGGRVYYALGQDHRLFAWLGKWNENLGTPARSLAIQAVVTCAILVGFGVMEYDKGFDRMVLFTTPVFWFFLLLVGVSVFIFRAREPLLPRPYRVALYPVTPLLLIGTCVYMLHASVVYAISQSSVEGFWVIVTMAIGVVVSLFSPPPRAKDYPLRCPDAPGP